MNILGIETSTEKGSCAFLNNGELVEKRFPKPKQHSQNLMKGIEQVLKEGGKTIQQVDGLAVSIGPGSFTGIRIGVSTARALGQALSIPVVGISSLDGLAWNIVFTDCRLPITDYRVLICPIIDALRGEVYTAFYKEIKNQKSKIKNLKRISDYRLVKIEDLLEELAERDEKVIFLGNAVKLYKEITKEKLGTKARFAPVHEQSPYASTIARLGLQEIQKGKGKNYSQIKPLYIRRSEAEEKFGNSLKNRR